jgi:nitronate monooxygenase
MLSNYRVAGMNGMAALVASVTAAVGVPVIAAGGMMDGRGVAAALALGAQAAQLGTAFLAAPEAKTAACHKAALLAGRGTRPTVMTQAFTGKPARGLVNRLAAEMEDIQAALPNCYNCMPHARPLFSAAAAAEEPELMPLWAGQGYGLCRQLPAAALVEAIAQEAREVAGLPPS